MLHKIHNDAGNAAVERWLEQYKDETNAGIQQEYFDSGKI
jgi:hypothetical protein